MLVPELTSLRLELSEKRNDVGVADTSHIRRVVVEHAPALFIIPCGESSCRDGGHDITRAIVRSLEQKLEKFEGDDPCSGQTGTAGCARTLVFTAIATYKS